MRHFQKTLLLISTILALFVSSASAEPIVYRGMEANEEEKPVTGDQLGRQLGIRDNEVDTYIANGKPWLNPLNNAGKPQGLSVATLSGCNLPPHRRPAKSPWNGTNQFVGLTVFQIDVEQLDDNLALVAAPLEGQPNHAVIGPAVAMSLADFRDLIHATQEQWNAAEAPDPACNSTLRQNTKALGMDSPLYDFVNALASYGSDQPTSSVELEGMIHAANSAGYSQQSIMTLLDAVAGTLEAADMADKADPIRTLQDRIYGAGPRPIRLR
ncbi:hypothetical protein [uncultured Ruegeria sp.]|uniref:hypothetical protein n=1 Tax=uncultured Ruegeria sp. TaxID=259304 RepID=UPI002625A022|nr:hypothetical protein [uncultured Ruegeria sp.]